MNASFTSLVWTGGSGTYRKSYFVLQYFVSNDLKRERKYYICFHQIHVLCLFVCLCLCEFNRSLNDYDVECIFDVRARESIANNQWTLRYERLENALNSK